MQRSGGVKEKVSISLTFYMQIFCTNVHVNREKLPKQCSYEKFVRKMLMKLTKGRVPQKDGIP